MRWQGNDHLSPLRQVLSGTLGTTADQVSHPLSEREPSELQADGVLTCTLTEVVEIGMNFKAAIGGGTTARAIVPPRKTRTSDPWQRSGLHLQVKVTTLT